MPNVVRAALRFSIGPSAAAPVPPGEITNVVLTYHAHAIDSHPAPSDDDLTAFAGITLGWWSDDGPYTASLRKGYLANVRLEDVSLRRVSPTVGAPLLYTVGTGGLFTGNVEWFPPQCAFLLGLRTLVPSRSTRGRMYFPAFNGNAGNVDPTGRMVPDLRDRVARLGQDLLRRILLYEGATEPTWALCVYSRKFDVAHAVTHFVVPDRVATQRRRAFEPPAYDTFGPAPI